MSTAHWNTLEIIKPGTGLQFWLERSRIIENPGRPFTKGRSKCVVSEVRSQDRRARPCKSGRVIGTVVIWQSYAQRAGKSSRSNTVDLLVVRNLFVKLVVMRLR